MKEFDIEHRQIDTLKKLNGGRWSGSKLYAYQKKYEHIKHVDSKQLTFGCYIEILRNNYTDNTPHPCYLVDF